MVRYVQSSAHSFPAMNPRPWASEAVNTLSLPVLHAPQATRESRDKPLCVRKVADVSTFTRLSSVMSRYQYIDPESVQVTFL